LDDSEDSTPVLSSDSEDDNDFDWLDGWGALFGCIVSVFKIY